MIKKKAMLSLMLLGSLISACTPDNIVIKNELEKPKVEERDHNPKKTFGALNQDSKAIMERIKSNLNEKNNKKKWNK